MRGLPRSRTALAAAGLAAGLLSAELALAAMGWAYAFFRGHAVERDAPPGTERVLFVGDSFTFGMGAPSGQGYPDQLQVLLRDTGRRLHIVNRARPGANSSQILSSLEGHLRRERPDILVVLAGWNDYNLSQSNFWKVADLSGTPPGTVAALYFGEAVSRLRTVRLARAAWRRVFPAKRADRGRWLALDALPDDRIAGRLASLERASRAPDFDAWLELGVLLHRAKRFEEGLAAVRREIAARPENAEARFREGWLLHLKRDFPAAKAALEKAVSLEPGHEAASDMLGVYAEGPPPGRWLEPLLRYDLTRMLDLARAGGVRVVLQTYPSPDHEVNKALARVFADARRTFEFTVVDHSAAFGRLRDLEGYFSGDEPEIFVSHPNAKGYRVMAENLARAFKEL